jgi:hypothetical protein
LGGLGTTIIVNIANLMADDKMPYTVAKRIDEALYALKQRNQSVALG